MKIQPQIRKEIGENPENYLFGFFLLGFVVGGLFAFCVI